MRGIETLWRNAIDYAHEYYDLLNEIRLVTGMSEDDSLTLGDRYRNIAEEMNVSSTDVAGAAVEFWRQGVSESEIENR